MVNKIGFCLLLFCPWLFIGLRLEAAAQTGRGLQYAGEKSCDTCHQGKMRGSMNLIHDKNNPVSSELLERICRGGSQAWALMLDSANPAYRFGRCDDCHQKEVAVEASSKVSEDNCLFCHGKRYEWIAKVAATVNTKQECLNCHEYELLASNEISDVHFKSEGKATTASSGTCFDCHYSMSHWQAAGAAQGSSCSANNCHAQEPHARGRINQHQRFLACETCHIPVTTALRRDWTRPVWDAALGKFVPTTAETKARPSYAWREGRGSPFRFAKAAQGRPASRIFPFRPVTLVLPVDAEETVPGTLERPQILLFDKEVYANTGDLQAAIEQGMARSGLPFSGRWRADAVAVDNIVPLNHGIVQSGLRCADCHQEGLSVDLSGLFTDDSFLNKFKTMPSVKFTNGALSTKHAHLRKNCDACHGDWQSEGMTAGCTASACHPQYAGTHAEEEASCSSCHHEHRGEDVSANIGTSAEVCLQCHERNVSGTVVTFLFNGRQVLRHPSEKVETGLIFSHVEHAEEIEDEEDYEQCTACHKPLQEGDGFANPSHLGETGCYGGGRCHKFAVDFAEAQPGEDCLECHTTSEGKMRHLQNTFANVSFSHEKHTAGKQKITCRKCHQEINVQDKYSNITKSPDVFLQTMESCVGCHAESKLASVRCLNCHKYHQLQEAGKKLFAWQALN